MNRVIVVDDEQFVRRGLLALVDWKKLGYNVVGEAGDGEDALALTLKEEPDLVLTDIRMPVFDGLELIKKIKTKARKIPKFVVVSGYSDFKYAQKAVRYGVSDFLLKPVDKSEIESVLRTLAPLIEKDKYRERMEERMTTLELFRKIITSSVHGGETEEQALFPDGMNKDVCYVIIDIRTDESPHMMEEKLYSTIAEFIKDPHVLVHPYERDGFGVVFQAKHLPENRFEYTWFLSRLKDFIEKQVGKKIFLFSGRFGTGIGGLKMSYETAAAAFERRYSEDGDNPVVYNKSLEKRHKENRSLNYNIITQLLDSMEDNNEAETDRLVNLWTREAEEKAATLEALRTFLFQLEQRVREMIIKNGGSDDHLTRLPSLLKAFRQKPTLAELQQTLEEYCQKSGTVIYELGKDKHFGDIHKIKRYIEKHYNENLTLKKIANQFYMNPVYLGQLFKKTYGVYFKDYLLEIRVEKAKKLLKQPDVRIYEVAEQVGFGSPDYFVTQFEKSAGLTPSKYRQRILNN